MTRFPIYHLRVSMLCLALLISGWALIRSALAQALPLERVEQRVEKLETWQRQEIIDSGRETAELRADIRVIQSEVRAMAEEVKNIKTLGMGIVSAVIVMLVQSFGNLILKKNPPSESPSKNGS